MGAGDRVTAAKAIADLTRVLRRTVPAPRSAPHFLLDSDLEYDPTVLDALSSPGIFRKYEFVLLFNSGLGGTARWLSRRLGCRVLGIDADPERISAAGILNGLARMNDEVSFSAAASDRLPFRDRVFTHVWIIDPPPRDRAPDVLAEAFRVLRSGAHFALQTPVTEPGELDGIVQTLTGVGFSDFSTRRAALLPLDQTTTLARLRLQGPGVPAADGQPLPTSCTQIFCRRS